jgi:acetylornithine aminotransferase
MSAIYNCTSHALQVPRIVKGEGIYLYDEQGKRYVDMESGVWCTSLGHGHALVNEAIRQQLEGLMHAGYCYSSPVVETAAESVLSITGMRGGQCVFLCSGSEAIELGRQVANHLTGNPVSMTLHDSYLGSYSSVTNRSENWYLFNWEECNRCPDRDLCKTDCERFNDIPGNISEFIFEPGSSSGFVRFPPVALIQNLVTKVRENGGKILVNEVTTGMGRTGRWFGYEHYDIQPDMVAIGKGVGNGYPVSVTAMSAEIVHELGQKPFRYMQSHQNDPLGAAVVHEVISIMKDSDLIPEARAKGDRFLGQLQALVDGRFFMEIRGRGLMFGLDLSDAAVGEEMYQSLIARGYIVCNRSALFRIDPPLTIRTDEFDDFIGVFGEMLASLPRLAERFTP